MPEHRKIGPGFCDEVVRVGGLVRNFVSVGGTGFQPVKKHGQDGRATQFYPLHLSGMRSMLCHSTNRVNRLQLARVPVR
jgi:hypothetical protein